MFLALTSAAWALARLSMAALSSAVKSFLGVGPGTPPPEGLGLGADMALAGSTGGGSSIGTSWVSIVSLGFIYATSTTGVSEIYSCLAFSNSFFARLRS